MVIRFGLAWRCLPENRNGVVYTRSLVAVLGTCLYLGGFRIARKDLTHSPQVLDPRGRRVWLQLGGAYPHLKQSTLRLSKYQNLARC